MDMKKKSSSKKKGLRRCAIATTSLVAIAIAVCVALGFTVFKPLDPIVVLYLVGLSNHTMMDLMTPNNVTTEMIIGITNENYLAGFKFANATSLVTFGDGEVVVGEAPVLGHDIKPRSAVNITTWSVLMPAKMMHNPKAIGEIAKGQVKLKSTVTLYGKSSVFGVKLKTSTYTECYLTIILGEKLRGESWCWSKLKIN